MTVGKEPFPTIYVDSQKGNEVGYTKNLTELYFVSFHCDTEVFKKIIRIFFFFLEVGYHF